MHEHSTGVAFLPTAMDCSATRLWTPQRMTSRAGMIGVLRGQLQETQWMRPTELSERQHIQLAPLLNHFERHSPWFRDRLHAFGLTVSVLSTPDGFRLLPAMTKRDIQNACGSLFADYLPPSHGHRISARTSGSTGEPTLIYRTTINDSDLMAAILRDHDWHRRDFMRASAGSVLTPATRSRSLTGRTRESVL